ncbi:MAG TPA: DoxX family protein, partial [Gammaproteobacteria bacterium]|nr:DoxX family protein [Gammaproteobacteria bacterium]
RVQSLLDKTRNADFLAPLALRLYLAPVFWVAANNKLNPFNMESSLQPVIDWFDMGLMLPLPKLMAHLAWGTEYFGSILLLLGLATRWISIPMMFTMLVAISSVHWENGWQAVHDPSSPWASASAPAAIERLDEAREVLQQHGDYDRLTEYGNFVVSNNGIEWAATYLLMLLALFFYGGGHYVSFDYWIARFWKKSV